MLLPAGRQHGNNLTLCDEFRNRRYEFEACLNKTPRLIVAELSAEELAETPRELRSASVDPPRRDSAVIGLLHARLLANAVDVGGGDLSELCEAASAHNVTIVCGINERDPEHGGGTLYNTVVIVGADGRGQSRHRKLMLANPERMVHGLGGAFGLCVVDAPAGRVGWRICWENYMPLARYALNSSRR